MKISSAVFEVLDADRHGETIVQFAKQTFAYVLLLLHNKNFMKEVTILRMNS